MRADGPITVKMFGGFSVTCSYKGEVRTISDSERASQKRWVLLEYLILHRDRVIPKEEIIDILWPGGEVDAPANTLKTLIHRVRASLDALGPGIGKDLILCQGGVYFWNSRATTLLDTEEFDRCYAAAHSARTPAEALQWSLRALAIYSGDFLPRASGELWVVSYAAHYRTKFIELCREVSEPMTTQKRYTELIALLERATSIEPYEEELHISLIRAMIAAGRREEAMQHYNNFTALLMRQLGVAPSEELTSLYKELARTTHAPEMNLIMVRERMSEMEEPTGAYFCEYEVFKEVFQLTARRASRSGQVVQLAMVSALSGRSTELAPKQLGVAMERLDEVINTALRLGDAYTRYSPNQYLLMLPSADYEDGEAILNRLVRSFRRAWPKMNVILHYSLLPVLPQM